ncbi:MAG: nucleotidyltransferase domain-containing protein [Candidatus Scalindua sp.]|nr:nucleotidyltransferase domain-containing protein [Candidatus Scalindua sp.]
MSSPLIHYLFLLAGISIIFGMIVGFILSSRRLSRAFAVTCKSIIRIVRKSRYRRINDLQKNIDTDYSIKLRLTTLKDSNPLVIDHKVIKISRKFKDSLMREFKWQIVAVYLFGSRARGNSVHNSDVDIAVIFEKDVEIGFHTQWKMLMPAFRILLRHGLYIQVHPLRIDSEINSYLIPTIIDEGIRV